MWNQAPTQNRFIDEMDRDRLYKQHMKALALMKPSVETRQPPRKFQRPRRKKPVRIFDGSKLHEEQPARKPLPSFEFLSSRSESKCRRHPPMPDAAKPETSIRQRPETARPVRPQRQARDNLLDAVYPRHAIVKDDLIRQKGSSSSPAPRVTDAVRESPPPPAPAPFGGDMWDTDESDDCESRCFEIDAE